MHRLIQVKETSVAKSPKGSVIAVAKPDPGMTGKSPGNPWMLVRPKQNIKR